MRRAMAPSVEPMESTIRMSMWRSRPRWTSAENITPDDWTIRMVDTSWGVPAASARSSSSSMGRANASPTMVMASAPSRSTVRHSSAGSKCRDSRVTALPPIMCAYIAPSHMPVPCMSGQAAIETRRSPAARWAAVSRSRSSMVIGIAHPR